MEKYKKWLFKIGLFLVILFTLYFIMAYFIPLTYDVLVLLFKAFLPFILAVVLAVLIDPLVNLLESKKIKRGFAVAIALLLLIVVITFLLIVVISRLVLELSELYQELPTYTRTFYGCFLDFLELMRNFLTRNPLPQEIQSAILNSMNVVIDQSGSLIAKSINFLFGLFAGLPGFLTILLVSTVATFFMSKDRERLVQMFYRYLPIKYKNTTIGLVSHVNNALIGFFRAEVILIGITMVIATLGLFIIRINYAFTIGIIVGFLDLLPVVGPGTLFIPWAIVALFTSNIKVGVGLLILYGIISVVRQLIEPKILAENIGLNPLAVLLSLYLGLKLIGISGIIIGPFIFIILKGLLVSQTPPH